MFISASRDFLEDVVTDILTNMVDRLASVLRDLAQSGELQSAVDLLDRSARGVDSSSTSRDIEQHELPSSSSYPNSRSRGPS